MDILKWTGIYAYTTIHYGMTTENYYQAARNNGIIGEKTVESMLSCRVDTNSLIDVLYGLDSPVEVKTCCEWTKTEHTSTGRRRGRYIFSIEQHKALVEVNGYYLFCLLNEQREVFKIKIIPAKEFFYPVLISSDQTKASISWKSIFGDD